MSFSNYKGEGRDKILARANDHDREFQRKARVALERLNVPPRLARQYAGFTGDPLAFIDMRTVSAANGYARSVLRMRLLDVLDQLRRTGEFAFVFGTIIHEPWHTNSCNTVINLADLERRTRNVVRMCGFAGAIMMIETQAVPGDRRDGIWPFLPHAHFIAWAKLQFNKRKVAKRVRSSRRLIAPGDARSFVLSKPIEFDSDLWRRGAYLVKEPYSGKKMHRKTGRFERTIRDMHPALCLRLTEVHSYIQLSEVLLLTGDATRFRKQLLAPYEPPSRILRPEPYAINPANYWDRVRASGKGHHLPVQIIRKKHSGRS